MSQWSKIAKAISANVLRSIRLVFEKLVRAAQDRNLTDKTSLFATVDAWPEAGRMVVDLPAVPGRKARRAELSVSFGEVELLRPKNRRGF